MEMNSSCLFLPPTIRQHISTALPAFKHQNISGPLNPKEKPAAVHITAVHMYRQKYFCWWRLELDGACRVCVIFVELSGKSREHMKIIFKGGGLFFSLRPTWNVRTTFGNTGVKVYTDIHGPHRWIRLILGILVPWGWILMTLILPI